MSKRITLIITCLLGSTILFGQVNDVADCSIMKKYKLQYLSIPDTSAYILLTDDSAVEYHEHGLYRINSKIIWRGNCEYDMILTSVTIPHFIYHPGDVMTISIDKIISNIVYYIATINGDSWEGKLKIIRK
ncbi:MAG TPA: hypothetical protein VMT76_17935 [Puia sp.]|nr:hypothetical protein [Puia sp.]